jgi:hypothetical protein
VLEFQANEFHPPPEKEKLHLTIQFGPLRAEVASERLDQHQFPQIFSFIAPYTLHVRPKE